MESINFGIGEIIPKESMHTIKYVKHYNKFGISYMSF